MSKKDYVAVCKKENQTVLNQKHLLKYERNKHGQPIGVVIAFKDEGIIKLGWSKCNLSAEPFDKQIGINKAISRAVDYRQVDERDVPRGTREEVLEMIARLQRYFQPNNVLKFPTVG
jgi:hypothetical protein